MAGRGDPRADASCPTATAAQTLARIAGRERLAACVNVGAPVESIYHWRGQIETAQRGAGRRSRRAPCCIPRSRRRSARSIPTNFPKSSLSPSSHGLAPYLDWIAAETARADAARRSVALALVARRSSRWRPTPGCRREPQAAAAGAGVPLSARALDDDTVEARFDVADGYYLYRDKLRFSVEPVGARVPRRCRAGKIKDDEFFGNVETYRGTRGRPLAAARRAAPGQRSTLHAESQGCADAGVCYPPQSQQVLTLRCRRPAPSPGRCVEARTAGRAGSIDRARRSRQSMPVSGPPALPSRGTRDPAAGSSSRSACWAWRRWLAGVALRPRHVATRSPRSAQRAARACRCPTSTASEQPLAQWQGKVLVVNFWATWCAPCREEMPQFVAAADAIGAKGLQFVGIAVDQADKIQRIRQGDRAQLSGAGRRTWRDRAVQDARQRADGAAVHRRRRPRRARSCTHPARPAQAGATRRSSAKLL